MRPPNILLTTTGFFIDEYDGATDTYTKKLMPLTVGSITNGWNSNIKVGEGVTLNHVFSILRKMPSEVLETLEALTDSNIGTFLSETTKIFPVADPDGLYALEIYRCMDIHNWQQCGQQYEYESYVSCHGLGKPWEEGSEGHTYALEFTPWYELRDLPIVIRDKAYVSIIEWRNTGKKRSIAKDSDGNTLIESDREVVQMVNQDWKVAFTLGEFFGGLFDELCFFGSPEQRDLQSDTIKERIEQVKNADNRDKN